MRNKSGFTLVEILIVVIILGLLAAIVIPQLTDANSTAKTSSLRTDLRRIRSQINLYKMHHNNNLPSLSNFEAQMTGTTGINGDTNDTDFGPYLQLIPTEPFTSSNALTANGTDGWNYNETTGEFWAPCDPNL